MNTYYSFLGLEPGASQSDITAAYQRQRDQYSAERVAGMDETIQQVAREQSAELERIYRVLSDPQQRADYDARLNLNRAAETNAVEPAAHRTLSRREWLSAGGVIVAAVVVMAIIWTMTDRGSTPSVSVGEVNRPVPDLTLQTLQGPDIRLQDYQGQVVLVNFWGTWCEPCKRETPALQSVYEELSDEGLMVVGINLYDSELIQGNSKADVQAFVDQYHVTYPIALDVDGAAKDAFQIYPIPTSYFIDPQGNMRYVRVGEITAEEVTSLFETLQAQAAAERE